MGLFLSLFSFSLSFLCKNETLNINPIFSLFGVQSFFYFIEREKEGTQKLLFKNDDDETDFDSDFNDDEGGDDDQKG